MIRKISVLIVICLMFVLMGCSNKIYTPSTTSESTFPTTTPLEPTETLPVISQQPLIAVSVPAITETLTSDKDVVLFKYTYQNMSLVLQDPEIADKVIIDYLNRMDATRKVAEDTAQLAKNAYNGKTNWTPYLYHVTYSPTRIDHGVLSFFGTNVLYAGGFHPDRTCISVSYDMMTGDVLTLASIMSASAKTDDFCRLVLDGLKEMSEGDYLYEDYATSVKQRFMTDASRDEGFYFTQTGLCFYFSPYEIAPYSSGVISVEIPYEKLGGLIYDAYFPAERDRSQGSIRIIPFEKADLTAFSQIAEVIENKDGKMYLGYTDESVQDVRIIVSDAASSFTIFAAYELSPGDAFMIQTTEDSLNRMVVSYKSKNQTNTVAFG